MKFDPSDLIPFSNPSTWSVLGVNAVNFMVGAVGGFMRALSNSNRSWGHRLTTCVTGAVAAGYLTPFVSPIIQSYVQNLGVTGDATSGLTGFLLGVGGLSFCEALLDRVKKVIGA